MKTTIFSILVLTFILTGCNNVLLTIEGVPHQTREIGNKTSDTVIVYSVGGPLISNLPSDDFMRNLIPEFNYADFLLAVPNQFQTLKPNLFTKIITFNQSKQYNTESVKMLSDVVKFYKGLNKKVYVWGESYGAFVTQDLIVTHGIIADGYVIQVGRLDMNDIVWQTAKTGVMMLFKDGTQPYIPNLPPPDSISPNVLANSARLASGLGYKRYTKLLNRYSQSQLSNVVYIHATKDKNVGALTAAEKQFLNSKKVKVIEYKGGHQIPANITAQGFALLSLNDNIIIPAPNTP